MKSLYLILAFSSMALFSNAQNFVYSTDQHIDMENTSGGYESHTISFTTAQAQGITYAWTLISNSLPVEWQYSLCDYTGCYSGIPSSGTMTTITPNENQNGTEGFFLLTLTPDNISGDGLVELFVYDSNNPSIGDTVSYHITHTSSVGIDDLTSQKLQLYPNPATDVITIQSNNAKGTSTITDALGQVVKTIKASSTSFDVSTWKSGVYFFSSEVNGHTTTTRFVVL